MTTDRRPVRSTYRLQLTAEFGFAAAAELVGYLADLGVSHLYLSPILQAAPGSTHGYDVADPTLVSAELGGEAGLRALADTAHAAGLGLVVDLVPNHVGVGAHTPLWDALLAEGQAGTAASFFDVDWQTPLPGAAGKVILPVLGDQYGVVLAAGELRLEGDRVRYHEHSFPLSVESLAALERAGSEDVTDDPRRLHALLEMQHYRLVDWRAAGSLVNYRRFFTINELAGVRVELDEVFETTHATIIGLLTDGAIDGLRIDHPDGLRDPGAYARRLAAASGGAWTVFEKIVQPGEVMPEEWPVAGTTGYEFANDVLGLFVDPAAAEVLDAVDAELGATDRTYAEQVALAKREVLAGELHTDARRVARRLWTLSQAHPEIRDVDERACLAVVCRSLQGLGVYRAYVDPVTGAARREDVRLVEQALAAAQQLGALAAEPDVTPPPALFALLGAVLTGHVGDSEGALEVLARWQQLSGAVMAKAVEDTVFYRYRRLLAVNEVGGDPAQLGTTVAAFHAANLARPARAMVTNATHDTKRGEDTRLRMAALSELPRRWAESAHRWHTAHGDLVTDTRRGPAPDPQTASLLYQTLVGVWPLAPASDVRPELGRRVHDYARKACREAGVRTGWRDPDPAFEDAVDAFLDGLLDPARAFTAEMAALAGAAAEIALVSGLAQVLLRCTVPGVPDTYQGTECWEDSLVDPDNRRSVDFAARRALLAELDQEPSPAVARGLWKTRRDGRVKLWVLAAALRARRDSPAVLGPGAGYVPLRATGTLAEHVVAFSRVARAGVGAAVIVAPRLPGGVMMPMAGTGADLAAPLGDRWGDTCVTLPGELPAAWTDALTGTPHRGRDLPVAALLTTLPVALLRS